MLKKSSLFVLSFLPLLASAESTDNWLPLNTRANFSAVVTGIGIFGTDLMQPVYGKHDAFFHGDFMGDYATDDTFLISPGGGYRAIVSNQIVGAYFFGDYEKVSLGEKFWVLSPGIEWMNVRWDAHLNGYFPTETSKQSGAENFASNLGDSSGVYFEDGTHNQYDTTVLPYDVIGNGVDAEVGYSFATLNNLRSRVYLGGYFYAPPSSDNIDNITGVTAGYEQPITKNLMVSIFNSYDQVSNYTAGVGLTLSFGEESTVFSNNIQDRMLDPIERHVGIIATGAGTYDQQRLDATGTALQYDNVYFMEPVNYGYGLMGEEETPDGTYGNPMQLTQTSLDTIDAETASSRIYLQGGTDVNYSVDASTATQSTNLFDSNTGLYVHGGQSFYGRSVDYTAPASSAEQPVISVDSGSNYNGFVLTENGENTFSDLTITSSTTGNFTSGIVVSNSSDEDANVKVNNTTVSGDSFDIGILAENFSTGDLSLSITNSAIDDNAVVSGTDSSFWGVGVFVKNYSTGTLTLNATDSSFNNNGTLNDDATMDVASGIFAYADAGTLNVNMLNSSANGNGLANDSGVFNEGGGATGVALQGTGNMYANIQNSTFNDNGILNGSSDSMTDISIGGLIVYNPGNGNFVLNITNSEFNGNGIINGSSAISDIQIAGLLAENTSSGTITLEVQGSQFNNNGLINGSGGIDNSATSRTLSGLFAHNTRSEGVFNLDLDDSEFNGNGVVSGTGSSTGANIAGLNMLANRGTINVNAIDSSFDDNGQYGIFVLTGSDATVNINETNLVSTGNATAATYETGAGTVNWSSK